MKLKSKRLSRSFSRFAGGGGGNGGGGNGGVVADIGKGEIKWEMRPGGMLVQRREIGGVSDEEEIVTVRVTTVSQWHDIPVPATSTFGELKIILSKVTSMETNEQRLLFKGKEREDGEHLHMVGVKNNDKVLMLQDPAIKEKKLLGIAKRSCYRTITV
ncbi:hypothetical protein OSB04_007626 [Centaurea solstitialis]|uniref:Ubiquitin-like domain-containing protein n=1 Tax=Centaurea solstitialis TaxID=347529 RepID=A0AA38TVR0_9ASTR|nr:hypothetical protein OSB04_007626 [Centaurea solstitialis]